MIAVTITHDPNIDTMVPRFPAMSRRLLTMPQALIDAPGQLGCLQRCCAARADGGQDYSRARIYLSLDQARAERPAPAGLQRGLPDARRRLRRTLSLLSSPAQRAGQQ